MKTTHILLTGALALGAISAANAAVSVTNGGTSVPSTNILTGDSTTGNLGYRPVEYLPAGNVSARGQSFSFGGTGDFNVQAIWVRLDAPEDFAVWDANSLHLNILSDPTTRSATPLGSFSYDATGLGSVADNSWLRFELGAGITIAAGDERSFLFTAGVADSDHSLRLTRNKTTTSYTGGQELSSTNSYDVDNRLTDPWDDVASTGAVVANDANLFFYVEGVVVPEPSSTALLGLAGFAFMIRRRR